MSPKPISIDIDKLINLYRSGKSCDDLTGVFGVSRETLLRRLKAAGEPVRQGPAYRTTDTRETKIRRAKTRAAMKLHAGPTEDEVARIFDSLGVAYRQQTVVGHYNIDFTLAELPVAVEIVTGSGNTHVRANRKERIELIRNSGYHVIECIVNFGTVKAPPSVSGMEQLITLAESFGSEPPARGEHRVIRADGEPYAARSRQLD